MDKLPEVMKSKDCATFMKFFSLYLEGVFTQHELIDLTSEIMDESADAQFDQLKSMISSRDTSRREGNVLMKPVSEFDKADQISKSYYRLADNAVDHQYAIPICSGRFGSEICQKTLNDRYVSVSTGQDDFRFKTKNPNEELLFKNEDEMYQTDHKILQLENIIMKLEAEHENARVWKEEGRAAPYVSIVLKE